jgi:hypothetical protein
MILEFIEQYLWFIYLGLTLGFAIKDGIFNWKWWVILFPTIILEVGGRL